MLLLGEGDPTQRRPEIDPDTVGIRGTVLPGAKAGVVERESTSDHPELAEPIELAGGLRGHPGEGIEVVDLRGDLASERRWIEPIDPLDRRRRRSQSGPEGVDTGPDGRHEPEPGDPDPTMSHAV